MLKSKNKKAKEPNLENRLKVFVKVAGGIAIKFFCPSFTGLPDRIVLMPGARIWFVELKSQDKVPSKRQLLVRNLLHRLGFEVWLIDRAETLDLFFKKISQ